jgi:phytoene synthase
MHPRREQVRPVPNSGDWASCRKIARHHGRSFFFASRCLPPARRRAALATYAYCRIADDIVDQARQAGPEAAAAALARWEAQLRRPVDPVAIAFAHARDRFSIPEEPVRDLLTGLRMDLTTTRYATWDELRTYCYHVAGTVGLMVAPIFGCRDPLALRHAAQLGIAMQLTNILRDVAEDTRLGRLYLPLDEIAAFGCDPDAILDGRPGDGFTALVAFQVDRARALYADALRGVPALAPSGRITTLAASNLYAGILTEIEALEYDVFRARAHVSSARKLRTMPRVATTFLRITLFPNGSAAHTAHGAPPGAHQAVPDASSSRSGYEPYG